MGELTLPVVVGLLRDPVAANHFHHLAVLRLFQDPDDLFFRVAALAHRSSCPSERRMRLQAGPNLGGQVMSTAVRTSGGTSTTLVAGDALELGFTSTAIAPGKVRDLFLRVKGAYTTLPTSRAGGVALAGPAFDFALGSALPNPTTGAVAFSFTMAHEGPATIRVYDVAGRLVKTLLEGTAATGPHELTWDATDDRGRRVGAGVYFYRMDAGSWRSQRKVVFLER